MNIFVYGSLRLSPSQTQERTNDDLAIREDSKSCARMYKLIRLLVVRTSANRLGREEGSSSSSSSSRPQQRSFKTNFNLYRAPVRRFSIHIQCCRFSIVAFSDGKWFRRNDVTQNPVKCVEIYSVVGRTDRKLPPSLCSDCYKTQCNTNNNIIRKIVSEKKKNCNFIWWIIFLDLSQSRDL